MAIHLVVTETTSGLRARCFAPAPWHGHHHRRRVEWMEAARVSMVVEHKPKMLVARVDRAPSRARSGIMFRFQICGGHQSSLMSHIDAGSMYTKESWKWMGWPRKDNQE